MQSKILPKPGGGGVGGLKPGVTEDKVAQLINGAPDARKDAPAAVAPAAQEPVPAIARRGRKEPISLTLAPDMIAKLDRARASMGGLSRPAFIALAVTKFIEQNGG